MKQTYVQFTAGRGPVECAAACYVISRKFVDEIQKIKLVPTVVDYESDDEFGFRSIIFKIDKATDKEIDAIRSKWEGTIKFISIKNSFRPNHKRKNWFIGCNFFEVDDTKITFNMNDIKIELMRSSGPGGQNVNKVESCVRLTHIPTGITIKCIMTRDQKQNLKVAKEIMQAKLDSLNNAKKANIKNLFWMSHDSLERGGEIMIIKGEI